MTTATQIFANYLDGHGITYRIEDERVLSVTSKGDNAPKIRVLFIFGEGGKDVAIRCYSVAKVPSEKVAKAHETCSKLNSKYRWIKFYVDSDNEIAAEDDAVIEPNTLGAECFELLARCINIVDEAYPAIMGTIWGIGEGVSAPQKR